MDRDDIIRMAREAGFTTLSINEDLWGPYLERFAFLILSHTDPSHLMSFQQGFEAGRLSEREECAKVCDSVAQRMDDLGEGPTGYIGWVEDCAAAIRARGEK